MARLKDTYIEGDLAVEGKILVNELYNPNGSKFPYIDSDSIKESDYKNRIARFTNEKGGIQPSPISLEENLQNTRNSNYDKNGIPNGFKQEKVIKIIIKEDADNNLIKDLLVDIKPQHIYIRKDDRIGDSPNLILGSDILYDQNLDKWYFSETGNYEKY